MSESDFILNATVDGKAVEIVVKPKDLDKLYNDIIEYRQKQEVVHDEEIIRKAREIAIETGKVSTALLQRKLHIGYGRAASIIDELEKLGVVGPESNDNKPREVLV